jgi:DNA end-binding protein Ku
LIDTLAGKFDPGEYEDEYRVNVERLIKEKQKGKKIILMEAAEVVPADDIMDALRKSLDAHKKTRKKAA